MFATAASQVPAAQMKRVLEIATAGGAASTDSVCVILDSPAQTALRGRVLITARTTAGALTVNVCARAASLVLTALRLPVLETAKAGGAASTESAFAMMDSEAQIAQKEHALITATTAAGV